MGDHRGRNRRSPSSSISAPLNNNADFLCSSHYQEWARNMKQTVKMRESIFKFLYNLFVYTGETGSLVITLITGLVLPTGDHKETVAAIVLYLVTCCLCVAVSEGNKMRTRTRNTPSSRHYTPKQITMNFLMILKPSRYFKIFMVRNEKLRILKEESREIEGNVRITEEGLQALATLKAEELEDKRVDLYECFFQSIPMAILQCFFLFRKHESFTLCSVDDLTRLSTIFFALVHATKSVTSYETSSYEYQGSLHFLSFYKSRGAHPMVVYPEKMFSLTNIALTVCNFFTILSRFYTLSYFMAIDWKLGFLYLTILFFLNICLLNIAPHHLYEIYCNAPFGAHTWLSSLTERYMNLFCNVGTRLNKFTNMRYKIKDKGFRFPLPFLQIIQFIVPILATVYLTRKEELKDAYLRSFADREGAASSENATVSDKISGCPELSEWYSISPLSKSVGDYLFPTYQELDNQFATFNDIFNLLHVIWLFFICQLVAALVFAYGDLLRRKKNPRDVPPGEDEYFKEVYPILDGYGFWRCLLNKVINSNDGNRLKLLREVMLLTVMKQGQFYSFVRFLWVLPKCCILQGTASRKIESYTKKIDEDNTEVERSIRECFRSGHTMTPVFRQIHEILKQESCNLSVDNKLFMIFFAVFDRKMYQLCSHRVGRMFSLVGKGRVEKEVEEEDIQAITN